MRARHAPIKAVSGVVKAIPRARRAAWPSCVLDHTDVTVAEMRSRLEFAASISPTGTDVGIIVQRREGGPHFWLRSSEVHQLAGEALGSVGQALNEERV